MGASDYMVGNAPAGASYAVPLRNFLEPLQQGFDFRQKYRMQNAFEGGLPKDAQGQPDINAISDKLLQVGGANYASQLLPFLWKQKILQGENSPLGGDPTGPGGPGAMPPAAGPNAGPGNLTPPQASAAPAQPKLSSMGTDDAGSDTVRSLATELFGGRDVSGLISSYSKSAGLSPDAPLNPAQASQFKTFAQKFAQNARAPATATDAEPNGVSAAPFVAGGTDGAPAPPASGPRAAAPASAPGTTPGTTAPPFAPGMTGAGPGATAPSPGATAAGPGAPTSGPGAPAAGLGATTAGPGAQPAPAPSAAAALVPKGYDPRAFADALQRRASTIRAKSARFEIAGIPNKAREDEAKALEDRAGKILDALKSDNEPTGEQKQARDPAVMAARGTEKQQTDDITHYGKLYAGLSSQGLTAAQMLPSIQSAQSLINNPGFYSGVGENVNLLWKRFAATPIGAAFGADPNAPLPQEAFRKIMAANILHQVDDLKAAAIEMGGASGRIFAPQIALMEKAAQNPDNSVPANRYLTELSARSAQRNMAVAEMATDYKQKHGRLDPAFEKTLTKWMVDHPMFTKDEMADPRIIGAPVFRTPQDLAAAKLPSGTPFKTPDGRIKYVP